MRAAMAAKGLCRRLFQCCCESKAQREAREELLEMQQTTQQVTVSMLNGQSWGVTANSRTTALDLKKKLVPIANLDIDEIQLACGTSRLKNEDCVLGCCAEQSLPMDDSHLQLIIEEDVIALSRRGTEVPGLMDKQVFAAWPPLHQAAHVGDMAELRRILDGGVDVNLETSYLRGVECFGVTPLHVASARGKLDAVNLLLEAGADDRKFTIRDHQYHAKKDAAKCARTSGYRLGGQIADILNTKFPKRPVDYTLVTEFIKKQLRRDDGKLPDSYAKELDKMKAAECSLDDICSRLKFPEAVRCDFRKYMPAEKNLSPEQ